MRTIVAYSNGLPGPKDERGIRSRSCTCKPPPGCPKADAAIPIWNRVPAGTLTSDTKVAKLLGGNARLAIAAPPDVGIVGVSHAPGCSAMGMDEEGAATVLRWVDRIATTTRLWTMPPSDALTGLPMGRRATRKRHGRRVAVFVLAASVLCTACAQKDVPLWAAGPDRYRLAEHPCGPMDVPAEQFGVYATTGASVADYADEWGMHLAVGVTSLTVTNHGKTPRDIRISEVEATLAGCGEPVDVVDHASIDYASAAVHTLLPEQSVTFWIRTTAFHFWREDNLCAAYSYSVYLVVDDQQACANGGLWLTTRPTPKR